MTLTKIYIRNPFRQKPERIFYAIKRILRMAPSEHYGNYVRTCLNEKPRLKYCSTSSSYAEIKPKPVIRPYMVLSVYISFFQSSFRFPLASFCPIFLDIARYACKKPDENTLNIKQKYRLSPNTRFGLKRDRSSERRYLFSFMIIIRPTYPLYCRQ